MGIDKTPELNTIITMIQLVQSYKYTHYGKQKNSPSN